MMKPHARHYELDVHSFILFTVYLHTVIPIPAMVRVVTPPKAGGAPGGPPSSCFSWRQIKVLQSSARATAMWVVYVNWGLKLTPSVLFISTFRGCSTNPRTSWTWLIATWSMVRSGIPGMETSSESSFSLTTSRHSHIL